LRIRWFGIFSAVWGQFQVQEVANVLSVCQEGEAEELLEEVGGAELGLALLLAETAVIAEEDVA